MLIYFLTILDDAGIRSVEAAALDKKTIEKEAKAIIADYKFCGFGIDEIVEIPGEQSEDPQLYKIYQLTPKKKRATYATHFLEFRAIEAQDPKPEKKAAKK